MKMPRNTIKPLRHSTVTLLSLSLLLASCSHTPPLPEPPPRFVQHIVARRESSSDNLPVRLALSLEC